MAVGDWIALSDGVVDSVLPRRSAIVRNAAGRATQAADARRERRHRVRRHLARPGAGRAADRALPRHDLGERCEPRDRADEGRPRRRSLRVHGRGRGRLRPTCPCTSSARRRARAATSCARASLPGMTAVLLGSSGVGKSTLVNRFAGSELMSTGETRPDDDEGRHTTSHRELILLPGGGIVIDTPGLRELQLAENAAGLDAAFVDVEELAAECRFNDCSHEGEPGCAVRAARRGGDARARAPRELAQAPARAARDRDPQRRPAPQGGDAPLEAAQPRRQIARAAPLSSGIWPPRPQEESPARAESPGSTMTKVLAAAAAAGLDSRPRSPVDGSRPTSLDVAGAPAGRRAPGRPARVGPLRRADRRDRRAGHAGRGARVPAARGPAGRRHRRPPTRRRARAARAAAARARRVLERGAFGWDVSVLQFALTRARRLPLAGRRLLRRRRRPPRSQRWQQRARASPRTGRRAGRRSRASAAPFPRLPSRADADAARRRRPTSCAPATRSPRSPAASARRCRRSRGRTSSIPAGVLLIGTKLRLPGGRATTDASATEVRASSTRGPDATASIRRSRGRSPGWSRATRRTSPPTRARGA